MAANLSWAALGKATELRQRIFFTIALIFVCRLVAVIPTPGVDASALQAIVDRMAQADGLQGLAAFSGRGPCADGRIKPDLVAPGTYVAVPRPPDSAYAGWGVAENTNEIYVGGTGVAAEQVADAAKRARQWLAESRGIAAPSAALVKALLVSGARDLSPGQYGEGAKREIPADRPNGAQGFGQH